MKIDEYDGKPYGSTSFGIAPTPNFLNRPNTNNASIQLNPLPTPILFANGALCLPNSIQPLLQPPLTIRPFIDVCEPAHSLLDGHVRPDSSQLVNDAQWHVRYVALYESLKQWNGRNKQFCSKHRLQQYLILNL